MDGLERALGANKAEIQRELAIAEQELDQVRARERALEKLIQRARLVLGPEAIQRGRRNMQGQPMALHDAIAYVLRNAKNEPMSARELSDAVNREGLYRKRDSSPVEPSQIHARVHNYSRLFIRDAGRIRLRHPDEPRVDPTTLAHFDDAMQEVYDAAFREVRYPARRFLHMVRTRGGLEAAKHLLAKTGASEGFRRLAEAGKLDLTLEYQVLRPEFRALFTEDELEVARQRLLISGFNEENWPGGFEGAVRP